MNTTYGADLDKINFMKTLCCIILLKSNKDN